MLQSWVVVFAALSYVIFLFVVASYGDRKQAATRNANSARYALTLAIYCTSWTFFGSVGMAASAGFEFYTIYLGPILVFTLGHAVVRRVVRLAKAEKITSVADFLASRYGKSTAVGAIAALIAVAGTVPYIALQLKAIATSVTTLVGFYQPDDSFFGSFLLDTSFVVAALLAVFSVLFGTRHADATEHQRGLMLAISMESIVKLLAFLSVGIFATYGLFGGFTNLMETARASERISGIFTQELNLGRWVVLTFLSACAVLLLPRQFHVAVVENQSEDELKRASWLFPLYLIAITAFVIPVTIAGLSRFGTNVNADTFVLALPMFNDAKWISLAAFLGGLSAATAMVIVASVALAIMVSNNLVLPILLQRRSDDDRKATSSMEGLILNVRRSAILIVMLLAFAYYKAAGDSAALASIGLLSFAAIAQLAPSFFGGLIWRKANARGAMWGMICGFLVWAYTLFVPTISDPFGGLMSQGPFGIAMLRPQAMFGISGDPLLLGVMWSMLANIAVYILGSLSRDHKPVERLQASIFVPAAIAPVPTSKMLGSPITVGNLQETISRYLGKERTERSFSAYEASNQQQFHPADDASIELLRFSEQLLAGAIGAASARLVLSLQLEKRERTPRSTARLLDDASEALLYNRDLLQTAIDQVQQGISVFDADLKLACWNRQFRVLLDLPPDLGQVGTSVSQIASALHEDSGVEVANENRGIKSRRDVNASRIAERLLSMRAPWQMIIPNQNRVVEVLSNSMPDGGLVVSWTDITERVNTAAALRDANESLENRVRERTFQLTELNEELALATQAADDANLSKTRFLAAAGHDILQPLNAARLYASALSERIEKQDDSVLASNISNSLESVEDILDAILAISRLDAGGLQPNLSVFAVDRLLQQILIEFEPVAKARNVQLKVLSSSLYVKSDPNLMRRIIENLVSNAIKYSPSGTVLVGCRRRNDTVSIEVIDNGLGIELNDQAAIFTEFRRLESGAKVATGLGLGLSIVQRISTMLGHTVELRSELGKGSRFSISLPRATAQDAEPSKARSNVRTIKRANLEGIRVLCIDNEPAILEGMRTLLSQWGCEVQTAASATVAIDLLASKTSRPDVIIVDYHLGDENGIDLTLKLRQLVGGDFSAILVTADRSREVRDHATASDMNLLNKPVKPAALRALLTQRSRQRVAAE